MAERVVSIKLVADASGVVRGFAAARDAAAETGKKIADSARNNREEWATVGKGLTAVGVAITGIGLAAAKTGIEYNTLQQTTRAALTSLLGSAAAANAQMDKLDAFARNSPFSKQTFIQAQQQMLAFGIETKKVVPYLDAVQNAVAAAGGSNADIAGIVATMSKIQSSAKITATDLMEFGNRGVNAADLIGSQMGKTGAQIRTDITAGTLSATDALDALVAGMSERYEGAAANVKNTFAGAMDRVKAAWRDFSSELAKPLVDPNGGGALVDLLNWAADAMRNFEKLPDSVKQATLAVTGLIGGATLLGGSFMLLLPKILEFQNGLKTLGVTATSVKGSLSAMLPLGFALLLAQAAYSMNEWVTKATGARVSADALAASLKKTSDASKQLDDMLAGSALAKLDNSSKHADASLRQLNNDLGSMVADMQGGWFGTIVNFSSGGFGLMGNEAANAKKNIAELDSALAQMVSSGQAGAAASAYEEFAKKAEDAGWSQKRITEALPEYVAAQREASSGTGEAATQYQEAADKASQMQSEIMRLVEAINELNGVGQSAEKTNAAVLESFAKVQEYVKNAQDGVEGYSASLEASNVAGARNRAMLADYAAEVEKNAQAQLDLETRTIGVEAAAANYEQRLASGRQQIYDTAIAMGASADEAQRLTDKVLGIPSKAEVQVLLQGMQEAVSQVDTFLSRLRSIPAVVTTEVRTIDAIVHTQAGLDAKYGRAYGGTIGYAQGGTILKAATGMTVPGVGGGVSNGTVWGAGTGKSDSVLVRLSRGEEVIQEPYASIYRNELKAINRGDFHSGGVQPVIQQKAGATVSIQVFGHKGLDVEAVASEIERRIERRL